LVIIFFFESWRASIRVIEKNDDILIFKDV
jgi:hypothetical protein